MHQGSVPGCARSLFPYPNHGQNSTISFVVNKQNAYSYGAPLLERLFSSSADPSARDFLLAGCSADRKNERELWKKTLNHLDDSDFELDIATYAALLLFCAQTEALSEGVRVHKHLRNRGLHENAPLGSHLVQMYSSCGAIELANNIFSNPLHRDELAYSSMARVYARRGHSKAAFQLFEQMQQEGILPNKLVFNSILSACSTEGNLSEGRRMHVRAKCTPFKSDMAIDTSLINMYGKCLHPDPARSLFEQMHVRDAVAWNAIISASPLHCEGMDALKLFHQMQQEGIILSKVTCIHILEACANHIALVDGQRVHTCIVGSTLEWELMLATALIDMYGKCGCISYSQKIFCSVALKDDVVWTAMIAAFAQNGLMVESMQIFNQMQLEGMLPDKYVFSSVLSGCANQLVLEDGKQIYARLLFQDTELDNVVGSALVNLYGKHGCCEDARKTFGRMREQDLFSCNALISAYAGCEQAEAALQVFNQMQHEGVLSDKITFVSILTVCASQEALAKGKMLHVSIANLGFEADISIGNALANMYGKCGSLDIMCILFRQMSERSMVSWNTVIAAYAQQGKAKEALELFEEMQKVKVAPDKTTFICALSACATQGSLAEGRLLHDYFICCGFQSDMYIETALVSFYGKCGSLKEARRIFDDVPERDVGTWNAMISAYAENGKGEQSLELFHQMLQQNMRPTGITFISVLFACSHVGLVNEACYHFDSMQREYSISPNVEHYNCMIDLLGRVGRLEEAENLLKRMSMQPTVASLMSLLGACRNQADVIRAERIAGKVFQLDPDNASPYVILSNIYSSVGRVDDALKVVNLMKGKRLIIRGVSHCQVYPEREACVTEGGNAFNQEERL